MPTSDVEVIAGPPARVVEVERESAAVIEVSGGQPGPPGAEGPAGPEGPQGDDGPQGPQGVTGATGSPGPTGPEGGAGATGPQGAAGPSGPDGAAGATGPQGPQGGTGPEGPIGATGAPGGGSVQSDWNWISAPTTGGIAAGRIGVNNDAPESATALILHRLDQHNTDFGETIGTLVIGDHVYLQAQANATSWHRYRVTGAATLSANNWTIPVQTEAGSPQGTEPANGVAVLVAFQYTPPQGPPGPTGAQGPAGAIGPVGAAGATGPAGPSGPTGPEGTAGVAGPTGPTGPAGAQGAQGVTGAQGVKGDTGPQGVKGDTGAQGVVGPQGPSGLPVVTLPNLWVPLFPFAGLGTQVYAPGQLRATRVVLPMAVKAVQIDVSALVAGSVLRVCVFADGASGPGALLYQTADISGAAIAAVIAAIGPVPAGAYWFGVQNVGAGSPTLRSATGSNPFQVGMDAPGANNSPNAWSQAGQGTSVPNPFPLAGVLRNGLVPAVWLQAS